MLLNTLKNKKTNRVIICLILLMGGISYFYIGYYNKPHKDIHKIKTAYKISSEKLINLFILNKDLANAHYVEKTIEIKGVIKEINFINSRYIVSLQGKNDFSNVLCEMHKSQLNQIEKIKLGETIRIKGICKGYLVDVIMLNCIVLKPEPNE